VIVHDQGRAAERLQAEKLGTRGEIFHVRLSWLSEPWTRSTALHQCGGVSEAGGADSRSILTPSRGHEQRTDAPPFAPDSSMRSPPSICAR